MATTHWIHGNALRVESPITLNFSGQPLSPLEQVPYGWGTVVSAPRAEGQRSWFHLPLPMPSAMDGQSFELRSVCLLFNLDGGVLQSVHVWDGSNAVHEFNGLNLVGKHLARSAGPSAYDNVFDLPQPHRIRHGIGLSFFVHATTLTGASHGGENDPFELHVASAGADVTSSRNLVQMAAQFIRSVTLGRIRGP